MVCEMSTFGLTVEPRSSEPRRGALKAFSGSAMRGRGQHLPSCASGCFRPDAALLPLLPREDHPTCCDCSACARHEHVPGCL